MSAWAKEYLGWVSSIDIKANSPGLAVTPSVDGRKVWKIDISDDEYYILDFRKQKGFDSSLPGSGLIIWRIKNSVVSSGLTNNQVNADHNNMGVSVIEADGSRDLADGTDRNAGDANDLFPGQAGTEKFDGQSIPPSVGVAICNIQNVGENLLVDVFFGSPSCAP